MPRKHAHQLPLGLTKLVMEPTKNPFSRERLVILNKIGRKPSRSKGFLIKYFCEPAATIPKAPGFKEFNIVQRGIYNLHPSSLARKANRGKTGQRAPGNGK